MCIVAALFATCGSLYVLVGETTAVRRKAEIIAKADKLLGAHYSPPDGKPLRLYDEQTETGPPDVVIYWRAASYVIELIFAQDGSVARVQLLPEALLHSDSWSDVPDGIELSQPEMQWLVDSANALHPMGKPGEILDTPDGCFQSGRNLYCIDTYEHAIVNHYHFERLDSKHVVNVSLGGISIAYKQSVSGIVADVRVDGSQRQLKIDGHWYCGEKLSGDDIFGKAAIGSVVQLVTFGCAANKKVCIAIPEEPK